MSEIIRFEKVVRMMDTGRRAVNGVSFVIHNKEHTAVCGAAGSGKNTLMRLIAGMEPPSAGRIFVLDHALHEMTADMASVFRNRNIGVVGRKPAFMDGLDICENVSLPLALQGILLHRRRKAAGELLKELGLFHAAYAYPAQISAYEAIMASIARAIITQPKILMLYELTADLSERETDKLTDLINWISKCRGCTLLYFGVSPMEGLQVERTVLMEFGKVQEDKT